MNLLIINVHKLRSFIDSLGGTHKTEHFICMTSFSIDDQHTDLCLPVPQAYGPILHDRASIEISDATLLSLQQVILEGFR